MRALLCAASLAAWCAFAAAQDAPQGDFQRAKTSFESICAVCHGAKGEGGVGLPLKGIAERLTLEQTIEKIKNLLHLIVAANIEINDRSQQKRFGLIVVIVKW